MIAEYGLVQREDFEALHIPEANILCFRWIGSPPRAAPTLDELNGALRERYNQSGRGWITSTVLNGQRVLRVTLMNPLTQSRSRVTWFTISGGSTKFALSVSPHAGELAAEHVAARGPERRHV